MTDEDNLSPDVFYSLKKELNKQDKFNIKEICAGKETGMDQILKEAATAKYVISAEPLKFLGNMTIRKETEVIVLRGTAFNLSYKNPGNKFQAQYEKETKRGRIDQLMVSSDHLISYEADRYNVKDASSFLLMGNCRSDVYFDEEYISAAKEKIAGGIS